jgi:hypothetical protein
MQIAKTERRSFLLTRQGEQPTITVEAVIDSMRVTRTQAVFELQTASHLCILHVWFVSTHKFTTHG